MPVRGDLLKWINLLETSPDFALRVDPATQQVTVAKYARVPDADGLFWLFGTTVLACGQSLPSVLLVDTDSGGELCGAYWKTAKGWVDSQASDIKTVLGLSRDDLLPYDYATQIPLTRDILHD